MANYLVGLTIINSTGTAIRVQSWRTVAGLGRTGERRVRGPYTTHAARVRGRVTKIARSARGSARLAQAQFAGAVLGLVGARLRRWARLNTRVTGPCQRPFPVHATLAAARVRRDLCTGGPTCFAGGAACIFKFRTSAGHARVGRRWGGGAGLLRAARGIASHLSVGARSRTRSGVAAVASRIAGVPTFHDVTCLTIAGVAVQNMAANDAGIARGLIAFSSNVIVLAAAAVAATVRSAGSVGAALVIVAPCPRRARGSSPSAVAVTGVAYRVTVLMRGTFRFALLCVHPPPPCHYGEKQENTAGPVLSHRSLPPRPHRTQQRARPLTTVVLRTETSWLLSFGRLCSSQPKKRRSAGGVMKIDHEKETTRLAIRRASPLRRPSPLSAKLSGATSSCCASPRQEELRTRAISSKPAKFQSSRGRVPPLPPLLPLGGRRLLTSRNGQGKHQLVNTVHPCPSRVS